MSDTFDLLLTGGTVLNPASRLRQELDVGITAGRIAAMQPKLAQDNSQENSGRPRLLRYPGTHRLPRAQLLGGEPLRIQCRLDLPCQRRDYSHGCRVLRSG